MANIIGTGGDDFIHAAGDGHVPPAGANDLPQATAGADSIDLSGRGDDTVFAGGGRDVISFTSRFNQRDEADGGGGDDTVTLDGDYSAGVSFRRDTLVDVENLVLAAGHSYGLTTHDHTVGAGKTLTVDASALGSGDALVFQGASEADGSFSVRGGAGNDDITGGAGADTLAGGGGDDRLFTNQFGTYNLDGGNGGDTLFAAGGTYETIDAGSGDDTVFIHSALTDADTVLVGGRGTDLLDIGSLQFHLASFSARSSGFELLLADGFVIAGSDEASDWDFSGFDLAAGSLGVRLDGQGGADELTGTVIGDTLIGGDGEDRLTGDLGADHLFGDAGADRFVCRRVDQSTGVGFDTLEDMNFGEDHIDLGVTVLGIGAAVGSGILSAASFDADLESRLGASKLAAGNALLFTPDQGDFAGQTFLVVEAGGGAGYQAGQDLVFALTDTATTGSLDTADFI